MYPSQETSRESNVSQLSVRQLSVLHPGVPEASQFVPTPPASHEPSGTASHDVMEPSGKSSHPDAL